MGHFGGETPGVSQALLGDSRSASLRWQVWQTWYRRSEIRPGSSIGGAMIMLPIIRREVPTDPAIACGKRRNLRAVRSENVKSHPPQLGRPYPIPGVAGKAERRRRCAQKRCAEKRWSPFLLTPADDRNVGILGPRAKRCRNQPPPVELKPQRLRVGP